MPGENDTTGAPATPQAALEQLTQRQADSEYMKAYLEGDKVKGAEMSQLFEAAYPKGAEEAQANAEIFGPPKDPSAYRLGLTEPDQDGSATKMIEGMKGALHSEGVPTQAVDLARQLIERHGELDDEAFERSRTAGWSELVKRHGEDGARKVLADAHALYRLVVAKSPEIADMLERSGAANDWNLIEMAARAHRLKTGRRA